MDKKIPRLGRARRLRILRRGRRAGDADSYRRFHTLYLLTGGLSVLVIHRMLGIARSTIYKVRDRYLEAGLDGLDDRRCDNGTVKVDEAFGERIAAMVSKSPVDYGWCRPTWTRELLCRTMASRYRVRVSVATMGRVLADLGARLGRPRPVVYCPWRKQRRQKRLREIRRLVANLPSNEVALYADEVDIHLNPKIGRDWMLPWQQKLVVTPGKNEKRYIAGAIDTRTDEMIWLEGDSKRSAFFCDLVDRVMARYAQAKCVHIILDNYIIHKSKITKWRLRKYAGRLVLHFLPPYCPNDNPIERKWQDLHAEVTRNHRCQTMPDLMRRVRAYLNRIGIENTVPLQEHNLRKAA